jgi:hypothetical protein
MAKRSSKVVAWLFVPITIGAGFFFGIKFYELVRVAAYEPDGAFAVTPIVNYLLAGLGFLCMLGWAAYNGMFHDIERPKITMLENEERLDAQEREATERNVKGSL